MRTEVHKDLIYPTPLFTTILQQFCVKKEAVSFNEDTIGVVQGLREASKGRNKSNIGGWQSELQNPNNHLKPLSAAICDVIKISDLPTQNPKVAQMWYNVNVKGDWNSLHNHSGEYHIAGVYYVTVPKHSGRLVLRDPRPGNISNLLYNDYSRGEYLYIQPKEGLLILFPSYLDHFVEPSQTDEERISISFDITRK